MPTPYDVIYCKSHYVINEYLVIMINAFHFIVKGVKKPHSQKPHNTKIKSIQEPGDGVVEELPR